MERSAATSSSNARYGDAVGGEAKLPQEARVRGEERSDESPSEGGVGGKAKRPLTRVAKRRSHTDNLTPALRL